MQNLYHVAMALFVGLIAAAIMHSALEQAVFILANGAV